NWPPAGIAKNSAKATDAMRTNVRGGRNDAPSTRPIAAPIATATRWWPDRTHASIKAQQLTKHHAPIASPALTQSRSASHPLGAMTGSCPYDITIARSRTGSNAQIVAAVNAPAVSHWECVHGRVRAHAASVPSADQGTR